MSYWRLNEDKPQRETEMDVNRITLLGRIGKECESKNTSTGLAICNFTVATGYKPKGGTQITEWHNVTCFGKTAEIAVEMGKKGARVYVEGRVQTDTWEKDGVKQYRTKIVANEVIFFDKREPKPEEAAPEIPLDALPF